MGSANKEVTKLEREERGEFCDLYQDICLFFDQAMAKVETAKRFNTVENDVYEQLRKQAILYTITENSKKIERLGELYRKYDMKIHFERN